MTLPGEPLLTVSDLRIRFPTERGVVKAADGISYSVHAEEVLGIVGESGSGKTVTALATLGLLPRIAKVTGQITFRGQDLLRLKARRLREIRGDRIAIVFQDALAALNPLHRVGAQVGEAILVHHPKMGRRAVNAKVVELLASVGISDAKGRARQYPHELSGGMRQRVVIAMAIANDPDVLIADEPTTALDVTTQAQVIELLREVRARTHSALVLISHDLGVVAGVADRVMVMYAGKVVETGDVDTVLRRPQHPYTRGLLASIPRLDEEQRRLPRIAGQPPSLLDVPPGCAFHPRCPFARTPTPCAEAVPELRPFGAGDGHLVACHFAGQLATAESIAAAGGPAAGAARSGGAASGGAASGGTP